MSEPRSDVPQKKSVGFQTVIGVAYAALSFAATSLIMNRFGAQINFKNSAFPLVASMAIMGWMSNRSAKEHNQWVERVGEYEKERQEVSRKLGEIGQGLKPSPSGRG